MTQQLKTGAYSVLAEPCEYRHEEKRSVFTALLLPVGSREEALNALAEIRRSRPGASHYCWAYILGAADQPESQAFSDDGEPSGTAGKPMLNVLGHWRAGNCLAVVVRVFGGVKLGAGGLVRAYSAAVSQAVERAAWKTVTPTSGVTIAADFAWEERIRHCLSRAGVDVAEVQYGQGVVIRAEVPQTLFDTLGDDIRHITSGRARIEFDTEPASPSA